MKKGISLSIEVVVVLVLAVIVLAAVLFLFMSAGGSSQTDIQARYEQNRWCTAYVAIDPECKTAEVDLTIRQALAKACSQLQYPACPKASNDASYECIMRCCGSYCRGSSCTQDSNCPYCDPGTRKICYNKCIDGRCRIGAFSSCSNIRC